MEHFKLLIVGIIAGMIVSCRPGLNKEEAKTEIKAWWGVKEIDDVIIDRCTQVSLMYSVTARLVISNDTTEQMMFTFNGGKISNGPYDEETKKFVIEEIGLVKLRAFKELRRNLETLQRLFEQYAVFTKGKYPAHLGVKIKEVADFEGKHKEHTVLDLFPGLILKNPYFPGKSAIIDAIGDTSEWFPEYRGKVVYFPLNKKGKAALDFVLKGYTDRDSFEVIEKN